jgi:hypothetical protein
LTERSHSSVIRPTRTMATDMGERGGEHEWMGSVGVFPHLDRIRRGRGFEDVGIDAPFSEQAGRAFPASVDANYLFEGMAEAAAEGRALVRGEMEGIQRLDYEAIAGDLEMRERVIYPFGVSHMASKKRIVPT